MAEYAGEAALKGVDDQCNQQNQADHQAKYQLHLALNAPVFGAYQGFQRRQCLLHLVDLGAGAVGQSAALLDQAAGALQLAGVTADQVGQVAFEGDATVFGLAALAAGVQPEQIGK